MKCFICGGNHYKSDCPKNIPSQDQASTNTTTNNVDDEQTTTTQQSNTGEQPVGEVAVTGSANVTTGNDEEWDNNIEYLGLLFTQVGSDSNDASNKSKIGYNMDEPRTVCHKHLLN